MAVTNYNIRSAAFRPESAESYELSILTGVDSFAYAIRDRAANQLLAYHTSELSAAERADLPATILGRLQGDDLLERTNFGTTVLGWQTPRAALVPQDLYDDGHRREYLDQLSLISLEDAVQEEWHNELNAHLLYVTTGNSLNAITTTLRAVRTRHVAGGLLNAWGLRSRRLAEADVSICLRGKQLIIAAHRAGSLQFFNTYSFATAEDVLYYTLLAYEHCGLLPARAPLYVSGEILAESELYRLLYTYVAEVRFSQYGAPPKLAPDLPAVPTHIYYDLLCLS